MLTPEQNEDLRHVVLEILATRHPAALPARAIRRRAADEVDFLITDDHIKGALEFLKGMTPPQVMSTRDDLGSSEYWNATSSGVLAYERKA